MSKTELEDPEFGRVTIKRIARTRHIRLRVMPTGQLAATMPKLAPMHALKGLIDSSRVSLRQAIRDTAALHPPLYQNGDTVGSSHHILITRGQAPSASRHGQTIRWTVPEGANPTLSQHQDIVRRAVRKALDAEAKAYLPSRLAYLAASGGYRYMHVRYSNAKGRWGSCSSRGVISLNVALMNLPKELIDYVLIHELVHTRHLNHSAAFWDEVAVHYPEYKSARKKLKNYSPYL